ncbi:PAS domain-containing sensor histidine kinase [Neobacillus ginsengisoli]|uniref:histidine kinase n=1 Tax=Neobacillus ginsengisoli TaxID=904295 RepID=A0ABT9Y1Q3_9BACI|nr:PAS domain S-box protein [Neobacillus ginsengisoli]MDQ0201568.1 two-component system sporulation sensor kinase A [Neobacillus ginsengisoli]
MSKNFPIFRNDSEAELYNPDELIDLFLECTADGFAIIDMEYRIIRINHMYTKIFGYTEEDLIGKRIDALPHLETAVEIIKQVKYGKTFTDLITQRFHKNGSILDIAVSYSPFRNLRKEIIAVIAIFRDITKYINMERELKRTRELYKLITENTTDMIKVFTKEDKIIYASPSYEKVVGIPQEEFVGRYLSEFFFPEEVETHKKTLQKLMDTGEPQLFQKKIKTIENDIIFAEFNVSPIFNEQKEIDAFVTVGRNITERIKNDEALRNLDRLSIIGQLAAGVAHEIRNPLTSLKGFSKLLKNTTNKNKQDHYLSIITDELDRIDMIVNEFMSLAKPQAIQFERENLISIIDSTVNVLHPQALLHNVQINSKFEKDDIELLCSPNQLKQVFVNFLKNAIESMPNGGNVHIEVEKIEDKRVRISFFDEGTGIESDVLRFLGTPFYTTKDKGIGLGLTVSNKIIQEHNGTMKIESDIGKGTKVIVELQHN